MTENDTRIPSKHELLSILDRMESARDRVQPILEEASQIARTIGMNTESNLAKSFEEGSVAVSSTAGYSNTDHIIEWTGDRKYDRIAALKRTWLTRKRREKPENLGTERWSKPKVAGSRRRRIERQQDAPEAPVEPKSLSNFIAFVGQMTAKYRHDSPNEPHDQARTMKRISDKWRTLSENEKDFYQTMVDEIHEEYNKQLLEYRATGKYTPSKRFENLKGQVWIHKNPDEMNALEREISQYDTVDFRPRPVEEDEAYEYRSKASLYRRKLKLKGLSEKEIEKKLDREFPLRHDYARK